MGVHRSRESDSRTPPPGEPPSRSISLLMWPESDLWKWTYVGLGGMLCVLGATMLGLWFMEYCRRAPEQSAQSSA